MSYGKAVRDELRVPTRELRHAIPQVYAGYKELHDSALAAGALDARTKELIALAIAVSKECDGCTAAHAHAAVQHGATPQEAAEAIGVTFLMNGGPATVWRSGLRNVPRVLRSATRHELGCGPGAAGLARARSVQRAPARRLGSDAGTACRRTRLTTPPSRGAGHSPPWKISRASRNA